jgi:NAD(P)-dependent dehydrogenase (short-subunit alcohol dehydrogenase family)
MAIDMKLNQQVILIAGGATGIGQQTANYLAQQGAKIAVGDINLEAAQSTAATICSAGGDAIALGYDQSDEASINSLIESAVAHFGQLNGLFANAADLNIIMEDSDILAMAAGVWQRTLNVNVTGTSLLIKAVLPHLLAQGGGSIVCTSSSASVVGEPERPAYAASKAAINAICRHVSSKWGKQNIRCNALAPGFILTDTTQKNVPQEIQDRLLKSYKSERLGNTHDIAAAVSFLMSEQGNWVNGQVWHINGGVHYAN